MAHTSPWHKYYVRNSNVQSITDAQLNSANRTMGYDNLDRLRTVSAPNLWGAATYTYDALDNLTSSTVSAGPKVRTMTHTYDAATNRLTSLTGTAAYSTTFGYDPRGNIIRRGDYDGFGRRVSVVGTDGVNRIQVYSRDAQLMFAGVSSAPVTSGVKYIYLGNHILAEASAGGVQYNHTDGLGSPVARTDGNRAIVGGYTRYEPYGLIAAGPAGTLGFTGHVNATDVGLVYMQQRYYDPVAGRMLSVDPITTDASTGAVFNRYAYANNGPYKYVDPDGRNPFVKAFIQVLAKFLGKSGKQTGKSLTNGAGKEGAKGAIKGAEKDATVSPKPQGADRGQPEQGQGRTKDLPDRAEPGEIREGKNRTREYGPEGKPLRDYDKPHQGHERPHVHEWENGVREHPGRDYSPWPTNSEK